LTVPGSAPGFACIMTSQQQEMGFFDDPAGERQPLNSNDPFATSATPGWMRNAGIRAGFVQKVLGIVACQLAFTALIALPFVIFAASIHSFLKVNMWILILALIFPLVVQCYLCCRPDIIYEYPGNYLFLLVFTFAEGLLVGLICSFYQANSIFLCVLLTGGAAFGLIVFAMQTNVDFTGYGPYLFVALILLCLFGFLAMLLPFPILHMVYALLGALLFSCFIVYDIQQIVGGKKEHQLEVDDYIPGALMIYTDIIQLFLFMLQMCGDR